MASTTFNRYASVVDPTPGSALTTPAFAVLPYASGMSVQLKSAKVQHNVMMPNGASAGELNSSYWVEGTYEGQMHRDITIERALESLLMNTFTANVLTPGSTEKPLCYEKSFFEGATTNYRQGRGCQHNSLEIKWDADGAVDFSSGFIGISDSRSATMITGATYAAPGSAKKLIGNDVSVTIGALSTAQLKKGSLTIDMGRKAQTTCNPTGVSVGIGTSGMRSVKYSFSFYKRDFSLETGVLGNASLAVSLSLGSAANGWKFDSANVTFEAPEDEDDDSGQLITLTGVAGYDATALADVKVTKLT